MTNNPWHTDRPPFWWLPENMRAAAATRAARNADTTTRTLGPNDTRWCPTCRSREHLIGTHLETWDHAGRELGAVVYDLACGHQHQGPTGETGQPLPGAPYAGATVLGAESDAAEERLRTWRDGWDD